MSDILPIQNKLELALVAYLWTFGGKVAPSLLTDTPCLFDQPAFFTANPLGTGTPFDGVTWYPGHSAAKMDDPLPRVIVTCAQAGGLVSYAGYDDAMVEVLSLSVGDDPFGQARRHAALRAILTQTNLDAIKAAVNAPLAGPDLRAVTGFGLDALRFVDQMEGRDKESNQHGAHLNIACVAHLEAA
jgi:hypothetical protein